VLGLSFGGMLGAALAQAALVPDLPVWMATAATMAVGGGAAYAAQRTLRERGGPAQGAATSAPLAAEARFRAMFEHAAVGFAVVDLHGTLVETNVAFQQFLGYSADELRGRPSHEISPDDDAAVAARPVREIVAGTRDRVTVEQRFLRKDGEIVWGSVTMSRVGDAAGAGGILSTVQDVTAHKRAEEALKATEERYRLLIENSPEAIALHRDGCVLQVNAASAALMGAAHPGDLVGRRMTDLVHPDSVAAVERQLAALADGAQRTEPTEYRLLRLDGRTVDAVALSVPVVYDGRPAVQTVVRDVTARREAERALRESEARLRLALDAAHMAAWERVLPGDGGDDAARGGACGGASELDAQRTRDALLAGVHPDDRERVLVASARAVADRGELEVEFRVLGADGQVGWRFAKGRVVSDADGVPRRMVGVSVDVTERKVLETQLRHAQKMEAVGQLAGGIAHDFNNMLTVIKSYGQLLLIDTPSNAPQREDLEQIVAAADRAAQLTRQLLAFSRKQVLHPEVLDPGAVVAGVAPMLQRLIGPDVRLVTRVSTAVGSVRADPNQLEQVLVNLAVNSRDAMPDGGRLTIETADVSHDDRAPSGDDALPPGEWVLLAVSDTGHGMDATTVGRIFEPFFSTKGARGTGLGLSTVYGIVEQSGGHIRVASAIGRGTTFRIFLPRVGAMATVS
jgi:PAS domain S-box-containing protein